MCRTILSEAELGRWGRGNGRLGGRLSGPEFAEMASPSRRIRMMRRLHHPLAPPAGIPDWIPGCVCELHPGKALRTSTRRSERAACDSRRVGWGHREEGPLPPAAALWGGARPPGELRCIGAARECCCVAFRSGWLWSLRCCRRRRRVKLRVFCGTLCPPG